VTNDQKRRILVICNDGDYFLRHRLFVVSRLSTMGADVTVLAGGSPIREDLARGWKYAHVRIERFGFAPVHDVALMRRTAQAILNFKPDAVHLITLKPTVLSGIVSVISRVLLGYPERILITLPGLGRLLSWPKEPGERRYPIATALTLLTLRLVSKNPGVHFTFETRHDYEFWRKKGIINDKNGTIIEGAGVDPSQFYPSNAPHRGSKIKILFASRLLRSKGLGAFLAAARNLANRPDVEFLVAGMSNDRDPDSVSSEDLERLSEIRFLGQVDDMPRLLRECDVVCLPTRYGEGIPRILIEAAASGLASIASSHPGCLEVVEHGVTGQILFERSEREASRELSIAIERYLTTPGLLDQHKLAAHAHFLSRDFNQNVVGTRFCALLGVEPSGPPPE
jgi:glycosyltransferase involved in cell wall biosynthesis